MKPEAAPHGRVLARTARLFGRRPLAQLGHSVNFSIQAQRQRRLLSFSLTDIDRRQHVSASPQQDRAQQPVAGQAQRGRDQRRDCPV